MYLKWMDVFFEYYYFTRDYMAHNPNIDLHVEFCPCGCNANYTYTSVTTEPATHLQPQNETAWNNWWNCKDSWEEPNLSRLPANGIVWTAIEQYKLFTTLNSRIEKIIVQRMLPKYKKTVPRIVVGTLDPKLWDAWIRTISNGSPYMESKRRTICMPSHLPQKRRIEYKKVTWKLYMPKLSNIRSQWWRKKWINGEEGVLFRSHITKLSFGFNPFTEIITASLDYRTEFYSDEDNVWRLKIFSV